MNIPDLHLDTVASPVRDVLLHAQRPEELEYSFLMQKLNLRDSVLVKSIRALRDGYKVPKEKERTKHKGKITELVRQIWTIHNRPVDEGLLRKHDPHYDSEFYILELAQDLNDRRDLNPEAFKKYHRPNGHSMALAMPNGEKIELPGILRFWGTMLGIGIGQNKRIITRDEVCEIAQRIKERRGGVLGYGAVAALSVNVESARPAAPLSLSNVLKTVGLLGSSLPMLKLFEMLEKIMKTEASVMILGETGTGKELLAKALHEGSNRRGKPFRVVHCSAISPDLLESELFGHEKGSFTGAMSLRLGKFEGANGGTLFLDEINSMPMAAQQKLLRVLESRVIERVGGNDSIKIDVRLISATNEDPREQIKKGALRLDLYHRLNVIPLRMPSLRERNGDMGLLMEFFLERFAKEHKVERPKIEDNARKVLEISYGWPGNVRELRNFCERAVIFNPGATIRENEAKAILDVDNFSPVSANEIRLPSVTLDELERLMILKTLRDTSGVVLQAAKSLGVGRQTLYNKFNKYGITDEMINQMRSGEAEPLM